MEPVLDCSHAVFFGGIGENLMELVQEVARRHGASTAPIEGETRYKGVATAELLNGIAELYDNTVFLTAPLGEDDEEWNTSTF